jgi:hypothetical protein
MNTKWLRLKNAFALIYAAEHSKHSSDGSLEGYMLKVADKRWGVSLVRDSSRRIHFLGPPKKK